MNGWMEARGVGSGMTELVPLLDLEFGREEEQSEGRHLERPLWCPLPGVCRRDSCGARIPFPDSLETCRRMRSPARLAHLCFVDLHGGAVLVVVQRWGSRAATPLGLRR